MPRPCTCPSSRVLTTRRFFTTTPPARSVLFNLGGLAASREGQYLSKETGIPRTEYSSNIHLIRSSEVDPFVPAPGASKQGNSTDPVAPRPRKRQGQQSKDCPLPEPLPEARGNSNLSNYIMQQRRLREFQQQQQQQRPNPPKDVPQPCEGTPLFAVSMPQLRQQHDAAKPITFDALVEEHKQNKEALRNLQVAVRDLGGSYRNMARWTMAMLFTLLFITGFRWGSEDGLKGIILEKDALLNQAAAAAAGVNREAQGPPLLLEAAPAATSTTSPQRSLAADTQQQQQQQQPNSGGVLQWIRSTLWASGGK